ncbi:formylglycine-generating enzyme family protein [Porphyrobacter sp. AAP60]|uniref:formylglycine-generating enzyme family protein n=1 Tax=Porphyrobacter sp. AAP60 TaxID=1523423 RepID=UPI002D21BAE5|nr:formylglycine-generating enzyme family protein [Porphyrobacter sp. AAP60]
MVDDDPGEAGMIGHNDKWAEQARSNRRQFASGPFGLMLALLFAVSACGEAPQQDRRKVVAAACTGLTEPGMVWIAGGHFTMGEDARYSEEGPPREVEVAGFWMSQTEVTNAQFSRFVAATGYRTEAERDPPSLPGAPPEMLLPGSAVFRVPTSDNRNWWNWVPGASWRNPSGPESAIDGRDNDPVVQVTYNDALAYAQWAGLSLPSEEQWEFAARAGAESLPEPKDAAGNPTANYYQGVFPARDLGEDGFTARAPVGCFPANAFGLHDMIGNVWEWTTAAARPGLPVNVIKGGSYLCAANYCARYRPAARQFQERDLGTDHIGFRLVDNQLPAPR